MSDPIASYLKKHAETLVKDVGIENAARLSGKSKATLGRYYSGDPEHADRFMPVDVVARLEAAASFPHMTSALADLRGLQVSYDQANRDEPRNINANVVSLSQRFAQLMAEYNQSIADGVISINEAKRLLAETQDMQRVLVEIKLSLEHNAQT
ncbi:phage regulatory CII family protein [Paracoccus sp. p4-l81]|uniref:phage regulatory CII family protein n=1 Tax=unclassified Paracoccus (in: a-proteobacteria) TaxID=2688777 RepID=UPI0035BB8EF9